MYTTVMKKKKERTPCISLKCVLDIIPINLFFCLYKHVSNVLLVLELGLTLFYYESKFNRKEKVWTLMGGQLL